MSEHFDAKKVKDEIVEFIRAYYKGNNLKGAVLGISGGKDSAVVAGLMCQAIGSKNVVGLTLPCHSKQDDAYDAKVVADKFGFKLINIDLTSTYDNLVNTICNAYICSKEENLNSNINLIPRLRMSTIYYMAALLSKTSGGTYIVPGTSNACEIYVGYYTKGGDSTYDLGVITSLTVDEVIAVGEVLGVPDKVLYKTPDDGLSGMSDEKKLGVKYDDISRIIKNQDIDKIEKDKIEILHKNSMHKIIINKYQIKRD